MIVDEFIQNHRYFSTYQNGTYTLKQVIHEGKGLNFSIVLNVNVPKNNKKIFVAGKIEGNDGSLFIPLDDRSPRPKWIEKLVKTINEGIAEVHFLQWDAAKFVKDIPYYNWEQQRKIRDEKESKINKEITWILSSMDGDEVASQHLHAERFKETVHFLGLLVDASCIKLPTEITDHLDLLKEKGFQNQLWSSVKTSVQNQVCDEHLKDMFFAIFAEIICEFDSEKLKFITNVHKWNHDTFKAIKSHQNQIRTACPVPDRHRFLEKVTLAARKRIIEDDKQPLEDRIYLVMDTYQKREITLETVHRYLYSCGIYSSPEAVIERSLEEKFNK
ncbi:hypothetical protein P8610_12885 [Fictibacillus sp. UD]|uniref:hypothetical protein n=1 Tax=Fictibacillus sp. UD TaxID=3038777 RepID=UPI0037470155